MNEAFPTTFVTGKPALRGHSALAESRDDGAVPPRFLLWGSRRARPECPATGDLFAVNDRILRERLSLSSRSAGRALAFRPRAGDAGRGRSAFLPGRLRGPLPGRGRCLSPRHGEDPSDHSRRGTGPQPPDSFPPNEAADDALGLPARDSRGGPRGRPTRRRTTSGGPGSGRSDQGRGAPGGRPTGARGPVASLETDGRAGVRRGGKASEPEDFPEGPGSTGRRRDAPPADDRTKRPRTPRHPPGPEEAPSVRGPRVAANPTPRTKVAVGRFQGDPGGRRRVRSQRRTPRQCKSAARGGHREALPASRPPAHRSHPGRQPGALEGR